MLATADVTYTYRAATQREDGTPLSLKEIKYTRLYCDGKLIAQEAGADGDITAALTAGHHVCFGTHVDTNEVESLPGNAIEKRVEF